MFKLTPQGQASAKRHGWREEQMLDRTVGFLPHFLSATNSARAATQIGHNAPGGPWNASGDKSWTFDPETLTLTYPGEDYGDGEVDDDETYEPLAVFELPLTQEKVVVYAHAWVTIVQADGSWELDRRD